MNRAKSIYPRSRPWSGPGSLLAAATAVIMGLSGATPAAASSSAAAITIMPLVSATVQADSGSCEVSVVVSTTAFFSEGVRVAEVQASISGGPPGKADQHQHSSKVMDDTFNLKWGVGQFKPGDYEVTVTWRVHNGNGLSAATAKIATSLEVRPNPGIVKLGTETKCEMEKESWQRTLKALDLRTHADAIREGCPKCAAYLDSVAAGEDSLAEIAASLAFDPPDPNFKVLPTATALPMPSITAAPGVSEAAAAAFRELNTRQAETVGQARAALAAIERAQGAHVAGDTNWESRQSLAAAGFLNAMAAQLERLPAASEALAAALSASGFPNPAADRAAAQAKAASIRKNGPPQPPGFTNWYRDQAAMTEAGLAGIVIRQLRAAAAFGAPVTLQNVLNDPTFKSASMAAAAALRANASALTATPLLNYDGAVATPTAAPPSVKPSASVPGTLASPVTNGGFDTPALAAGLSYQTLTSGKEPSLSGWRLASGSIDVVAAGGQAATGGQFVDLSGNDTAAGMGVITQDLALTSGHRYRLSFQISGNPNGDPAVKTLEVTFGEQMQTVTFDTKGHTNADLGWTTHTMEITSCGGSPLSLSFASKTEGQRGPNLDDIVVTDLGGASCSGIPAWLLWLGGAAILLGAVALVIYLRRRAARRKQPALVAAGPDEPTAVL